MAQAKVPLAFAIGRLVRDVRSFRVLSKSPHLLSFTGWRSMVAVTLLAASHAEAAAAYQKQPTWSQTLLSCRSALQAAQSSATSAEDIRELAERIHCDFPVASDWALQDFGSDFARQFFISSATELERKLLTTVLRELPAQALPLRREFDFLVQRSISSDEPAWLDLYTRACELRRSLRLATLLKATPKIVFTRRPTLLPSFFAYTEGQSDAQNERHFTPNSELCLLQMDGLYGQITTLLRDQTGAIRDPAVSWDAKHVVFAWKKSLDGDDYHLYEMDLASKQLRQLTTGLGFADYEPAYLPNGDLIFASTRCVQTVDCWWTEVSNLYTCDGEGRYLRRLSFDQVHAIYPSVTDDGRVLYTRWDYNDRGQIFPQPLFQMNADGTGQSEFYGNSSWFPTTIAHARALPGSQKVLAVLCGHHTAQAGKLAIIDPGGGRQEGSGVQLIAPVRETKPERIDAYGQEGELFQYPYPLNDREFLVGYTPVGWEFQNPRLQATGGGDFGIYWMDRDGRRELLAFDPHMPSQQPVPVAERNPPPARPSSVHYEATNGVYYMQDIYAGNGLAGVTPGTIKKLRVISLQFRAAGIGNNGSGGPGGGALVSTPIAIGNGSWDVKTVLGDATVYEDGSAYFSVPARVPLYFQALDENNHAVQTMRTWSTLQPGESQSCIGCHDAKDSTPTASARRSSMALSVGLQTLQPFYGPPRGFSFLREVQPTLDRHCIRCHNDPQKRMPSERLQRAIALESDPEWPSAFGAQEKSPARPFPNVIATTKQSAFSLMATSVPDGLARRTWTCSYLNLTSAMPSDDAESRSSFFGIVDGRFVNWIGSQSIPAPLPPYTAGACRSELIPLLKSGHGGVQLSQEEFDKLACWLDLFVPFCGDYTEANIWSAEEKAKYQHFADKRRRMEEIERQNIQQFISRPPLGASASP